MIGITFYKKKKVKCDCTQEKNWLWNRELRENLIIEIQN